MSATDPRPLLVFTQGDPAGIGPEILLKVADEPRFTRRCRPILVLEQAAVEAIRPSLPGLDWSRFRFFDDVHALQLEPDVVPILDPKPGPRRRIRPGEPQKEDADGALAALDLGIHLATAGADSVFIADGLVTAPLNKAEIARYVDPTFRGHTDYLAEKAGLGIGDTAYGTDYLMAFLAPDLKVALLSTHISLSEAIERVTTERVLAALRCMGRHTEGKILVAGLDPHAGEGGLIGTRDDDQVRPAVEQARREGIDVGGPESADSLFARAQRGACDWILALYHDQGLIGLKTAAFGDATNWTMGLPYIRTSVDHGTAYDIAGQGIANPASLRAVVEATVDLVTAKSGRSA